MDFKQMELFMVLAETMNYRKAAETLSYSPSTINKQIHAIENELGVSLIIWEGQRLRLTQAGRAFREHAAKMLTCYEEMLTSFGVFQNNGNPIRIGGCDINTAYELAGLFKGFTHMHPDIHLAMNASSNAMVPEMIRKGMIDIGFHYSVDQSVVDSLQEVYLYQEPVMWICARSHPLLSKGEVHYEDFEGCELAFSHDDCCFEGEMLSRIKERGIHLGKVYYMGGYQMSAERVQESNSLMLVPYAAAKRLSAAYNLALLKTAESPVMCWERMLFQNYVRLTRQHKLFIQHTIARARKRANTDREYIMPDLEKREHLF